MPKLISQKNNFGTIQIKKDGTTIGQADKIDFENKDIRIDVNTGIATVFTDPLTVLGL